MKPAPATPELPVADVEQAQRHDRDTTGSEINWHNAAGGIGAVSHGDCALFLRAAGADRHPATVRIFTDDIDRACSDFAARGATIVDPVGDKPRGVRPFSLRALDGNLIRFHHDL